MSDAAVVKQRSISVRKYLHEIERSLLSLNIGNGRALVLFFSR